MTNSRKHVFATVVVLAAALGGATGLALAQGSQSMYGTSPSAQSATTQGTGETLPPQAVDASPPLTSQPNADEAAGSDDSDNSATDSDAAGADSDDSTSTVEGAVVPSEPAAIEPAPVYESVPAYIAPPNSPRYTPETGDAEYGSKLDPVGPQSNRFNDATGQ